MMNNKDTFDQANVYALEIYDRLRQKTELVNDLKRERCGMRRDAGMAKDEIVSMTYQRDNARQGLDAARAVMVRVAETSGFDPGMIDAPDGFNKLAEHVEEKLKRDKSNLKETVLATRLHIERLEDITGKRLADGEVIEEVRRLVEFERKSSDAVMAAMEVQDAEPAVLIEGCQSGVSDDTIPVLDMGCSGKKIIIGGIEIQCNSTKGKEEGKIGIEMSPELEAEGGTALLAMCRNIVGVDNERTLLDGIRNLVEEKLNEQGTLESLRSQLADANKSSDNRGAYIGRIRGKMGLKPGDSTSGAVERLVEFERKTLEDSGGVDKIGDIAAMLGLSSDATLPEFEQRIDDRSTCPRCRSRDDTLDQVRKEMGIFEKGPTIPGVKRLVEFERETLARRARAKARREAIELPYACEVAARVANVGARTGVSYTDAMGKAQSARPFIEARISAHTTTLVFLEPDEAIDYGRAVTKSGQMAKRARRRDKR